MKIYNEVVTRFNETTNKWETISEDSFNYTGPVDMAQGVPPNSSPINTSDTIADTVKTTTGYFTDGDPTLAGKDIFTGSFKETAGVTGTPVNDANKKYYFNIEQAPPVSASAETQFSITFGHINGSGSDNFGGESEKSFKGTTEAIYRQLNEKLQISTEASGGFKISAGGSLAKATTKDEYIYALIGKRARFKERMNKKAWTLVLSGSTTTGSGVQLSLTDDSKDIAAVATPGGPRYNIVAGALGVVTTPAATTTYGWYYPEMGIMLFSGAELSASIPGGPNYGNEVVAHTGIVASASNGREEISSSAANSGFTSLAVGDMFRFVSSSGATFTAQVSGGAPTTAGFTASRAFDIATGASKQATGSIQKGYKTTEITASWGAGTNGVPHYSIASASGFAPNLHGKGNPFNALRLANCMTNLSSSMTLRLRSEEDATQENYFCRIKAGEYNFSSNHTFVSGSKNKIRNADMHGNPTTFITGVGLYNSSGQLLAIATLSKPLKKNFASEATVKVKLTY
tara:strand:+ start:2511 stop:4055 length:1545 start_codon:yes stop_codon:yes gene_type:complete